MPIFNFPFRVERAVFVSQMTENVRSEQRKEWRSVEKDMKKIVN